jgi:hypothetical protein
MIPQVIEPLLPMLQCEIPNPSISYYYYYYYLILLVVFYSCLLLMNFVFLIILNICSIQRFCEVLKMHRVIKIYYYMCNYKIITFYHLMMCSTM